MTLNPNHCLDLKNGAFNATGPAELTGLFQTLAADPQRERLVVHFHGGLVSAANAATSIDTTLLSLYRQAGAYPVFFVWHSGALEVIQHNLAEIFREKIYQRLLARVLQFVEAKLRQQPGERGGRLELQDEFEFIDPLRQAGPTEVPLARLDTRRLAADAELTDIEADQFRETLEQDVIIPPEAAAIAAGLRSPAEIERDRASRSPTVPGSRHSLMSPEALRDLQPVDPAERGLVSTSAIITGAGRVLGRVIKRLAQGRGHGVYTTCVEELLREFYLANAGRQVWTWMKEDTADAFGDDPGRYGGTAFLEQLKAAWQPGQQITLVGHSTGAIYICHLLAHAAQRLPPEIKFDVVFLAPACDFRLWADTLALHGDRIRHFRQFGMSDALEAQDRLVPQVPVYPRSLLYLVSGLLEDEPDQPIVGMERYYTDQPPYDRYREIELVRRFAAGAARPRLVWAETDAGPGRRSQGTSHGAFDDEDPATLASLQYLIREGF